MIVIYAVIFLVAAIGASATPHNADFLGKKQAAALKGIFVMLVFASHSWQYVKGIAPDGILTLSFSALRTALGQMIVVPFMFFSGYGVRYSIERRGDAYIRSMPKQRILKLYLHVVPIVLLFLCLQLALGREYEPGFVLSAFVLWESLGNSNWYIFAILVLYIITYISFGIFKDHRRALLLCTVLTLAYIVLMSLFKATWWYDTVLAYVFGMLFFDLSQSFYEKLTQSRSAWGKRLALSCVALLVAAAAYLASVAFLKDLSPRLIPALLGNGAAVAFMLVLLVLSLKLSLGNRIINWLGDHIFEVYLLQRLPMILFTEIGLAEKSLVLWYVLCILCTVLLAVGSKRLTAALDARLFRPVAVSQSKKAS